MDNPFESLLEDKKKEVSSSPFDSLLQMDVSGNKIEKQKLSLEPAEKKSIHTTPVKLTERSGRYRIGKPDRPHIKHDGGFLAKLRLREPTAIEKLQFAKWVTILEGLEAVCSGPSAKIVGACWYEDLSDAAAAYRHFLFGKGKDRTFNYERYILNDPAGKELLENLISDFQNHIENIGRDRIKFSVTSSAYNAGNSVDAIAPYPKTVNWQKTLGAHYLWVSADIAVSANKKGDIMYNADLTINVEDQYNFNPGQNDIASGIPDSANGIFEVTGLGSQYMHFAKVKRQITWVEKNRENSKKNGSPTSRQRKPDDNRRLRNRV